MELDFCGLARLFAHNRTLQLFKVLPDLLNLIFLSHEKSLFWVSFSSIKVKVKFLKIIGLALVGCGSLVQFSLISLVFSSWGTTVFFKIEKEFIRGQFTGFSLVL